MYSALLHAHSGIRWIVLITVIAAFVNAFVRRHEYFNQKDRKFNLVALISVHVQAIVGLLLYFVSPKVVFNMSDSVLRFFSVEHLILMLLAIVCITLGHRKTRQVSGDAAKFRVVVRYYGIGLFLMLIGIPWPFREALGSGWM